MADKKHPAELELKRAVRRWVRNAVEDNKEVHRLRTADYGRVLGTLPDWVPRWHRERFERARNTLLEHIRSGDMTATAAQVQDWVTAYRALGDPDDCASLQSGSFPVKFQAEIECIKTIFRAVSADQIGGLALLGDEAGARFGSFSKNILPMACRPGRCRSALLSTPVSRNSESGRSSRNYALNLTAGQSENALSAISLFRWRRFRWRD